jgi:DNA helicase TIP49 (TBP-interacting protein)
LTTFARYGKVSTLSKRRKNPSDSPKKLQKKFKKLLKSFEKQLTLKVESVMINKLSPMRVTQSETIAVSVETIRED